MSTPTTNPLRVGLRQERVIAPQCLVIFGASGDLTHRKLIPALFQLFKQRRLPSEFAILGCARRLWSDEEFRQKMEKALKEEAKENQVSTDTIINQIQDEFWEFAQSWELSCYLDYAEGDFYDIFNRQKEKGKKNE